LKVLTACRPKGDPAENVKISVSAPKFLFAPLVQGRQVGKVRATRNGEVIFETGLFLKSGVSTPEKVSFWAWLIDKIVFWK
jgi:hypothetical protein